ncbi:hypothetical protein [Halotalea alkalilenta]|nr:hypothetical protein [Halotalea alkalilenta]
MIDRARVPAMLTFLLCYLGLSLFSALIMLVWVNFFAVEFADCFPGEQMP